MPNSTGRKALTVASLAIPAFTTFGRTGIVVLALQTDSEIDNPEWVVGADAIAIAIAYWAMFSGYSYGYVQRILTTTTTNTSTSSTHQKVGGTIGFTSGTLMALSEGILNFLGTRHLLSILGSADKTMNIVVPTFFALSSLFCWFTMVPPKAQGMLKNPKTIFPDDLSSLNPLQKSSSVLLGAIIGVCAGIGLSGTAAFGVLELIKLVEGTSSLSISTTLKLLIILFPTLGTALAASLFYTNKNSNLIKLVGDLKKSCKDEVDDMKGRWQNKNILSIFFKAIQWALCAFVISGGFYATYTLSVVSIHIAMITMLNTFTENKDPHQQHQWLNIFQQITAGCLGFTATAMSGTEGCKLILSKYQPTPTRAGIPPRAAQRSGTPTGSDSDSPDDADSDDLLRQRAPRATEGSRLLPEAGGDGGITNKPLLWFTGYYVNKARETIAGYNKANPPRDVESPAERSAPSGSPPHDGTITDDSDSSGGSASFRSDASSPNLSDEDSNESDLDNSAGVTP